MRPGRIEEVIADVVRVFALIAAAMKARRPFSIEPFGACWLVTIEPASKARDQ